MSMLVLAVLSWVPLAASHPMVAWTGKGSPALISTNAPILRWTSQVDSGGTFAYQVDVITEDGGKVWSSGEVWQGNWPVTSLAFPGLCVYEGPQLQAGATYFFTVMEHQAANGQGVNISRSWSAGRGSFKMTPDLRSAKDELIHELKKPNMTKLWETSSTSLWSRVEPSGFLPTSVSGGYGGITHEYVRDGAGMIVGILELGKEHWPIAQKAMRFMLHGLQCTQNAAIEPGCQIALNMSKPPEVIYGDCTEEKRKTGSCNYSTEIIGVDTNEETDGAFYVIGAWGRVIAITGDLELEKDFYTTLKTYMSYYLSPGAVSTIGVPYFNASLGLLWTPHLEHSRLTKMWAAYDSLTNSFAIEALRYMITAAKRQEPGNPKVAKVWDTYRQKLITGLDTSLTYKGIETGNKDIYAELLGHVDGYGPLARDPAPLLFGMSWVQLATINAALSNLSNAGGSVPLIPIEDLGISFDKLDHTFETYSRSGSFLWINADESLSALVQTTNVNSSRLRSPPYRSHPPAPIPEPKCDEPLHGKSALTLASGFDHWGGAADGFQDCCHKCDKAGIKNCTSWFWNGDDKTCYLKVKASLDPVTKPSPNFYAGLSSHTEAPAWCDYSIAWPFGGYCEPGCPCPARVVIGKGLGWETGWMAHKQRWTRLIAMTRWLGAAHHVETQPLYGENIDYDCIKALEKGVTVVPSNGRCWGDAGNGVQIGWWVWGQALLRRKLGMIGGNVALQFV